MCVFNTASQFISLISAAFCAPIRSLTLQHIQSIGRKKEKKGGRGGEKSLLTSFAPSRKCMEKRKERMKEKAPSSL